MPDSASDPLTNAPGGPIGVFDSGVGGLSVLDALVARFPRQVFHYLGDTRHMPYGEKTPDELLARIVANLHWLRDGCGAHRVVFACNSSTGVLSVRSLPPDALPWPDWLGPVEPVCRHAAACGYARIATLATPTTAATGIYSRTLHGLNPQVTTCDIPAPGLADAIEHGQSDTPVFQDALARWLAPVRAFAPDALILGCTHYPFVARQIAECLGPDVALLDPAPHMAEAMAAWQPDGTPAGSVPPGANVTYAVTGNPAEFAHVARRLPLAHLTIGAVAQAQTPEALSLTG